MLAMGWNIERTKEGEAMFQQLESEKQRKLSESQVKRCYSCLLVSIWLLFRSSAQVLIDISLRN